MKDRTTDTKNWGRKWEIPVKFVAMQSHEHPKGSQERLFVSVLELGHENQPFALSVKVFGCPR